MEKTNAVRAMERLGLEVRLIKYDAGDGEIDALATARMIERLPQDVYKTLVTIGKEGTYYVFIIPSSAELDLKKAAKAVGKKSIEMIKPSDLKRVTGYIRGGCSPVGMNKNYCTTLDISAKGMPGICVSAGKIGLMMETAPRDLLLATGGQYADILI